MKLVDAFNDGVQMAIDLIEKGVKDGLTLEQSIESLKTAHKNTINEPVEVINVSQ